MNMNNRFQAAAKLMIGVAVIVSIAGCASLKRYHNNEAYSHKIAKGETKAVVLTKLGEPNAFHTSTEVSSGTWTGCNTTILHYLPLIGFPLLQILNPIECNSMTVAFDKEDKVNSITAAGSGW